MKKNTVVILLGLLSFPLILFSQTKVELSEVSKEFQKNNFEKVIELSEKSIKEGAQQPEFYFYLGSSYLKLSKKSEAIKFLKNYLEKEDFSKNIWMIRQAFQNLVNIYKEDNDLNSIVKEGNLFFEKSKTSTQASQIETFCKNFLSQTFNEIGNQRASKNDYEGAIEAFKKLLEYKPNDASIFERIAVWYKNLGQNVLAAEYHLKSAMNWSAWVSKINPLASVVELLWDTDKFIEFSKIAENEPVCYNFLLAADEIKKEKYSDAFSRLKKVEENIGSKGKISERLLRTIYQKRTNDPWLIYFFLINFPENTYSPWAADIIINLGRNNPDTQKQIKEKMYPPLMKIVKESSDPEVRKLFPKIVDMKFIGDSETKEITEEKVRIFEEFVAKYPEDPVIPEILRKLAGLYVENLSDYRKGKEIYGLLVNKYNQKSHIIQLAKCMLNLNESDEALSLLRQFTSDKNTGENEKFQAAQMILSANFFDEGIKILKEIDESTKNRWLKQQIADVLKDYRQYLHEDISVESMGRFVVFNLVKKKYYFTNFISVDENSPAIFQETENLEIVPFSNKREGITCLIECISKEEFSYTEPYGLIFKRGDFYTCSLKKRIFFSPDRWRKIEGLTVYYPWFSMESERLKIIRSYTVQDNYGISTITFQNLSPGMKIEVTFSSRAGRLEQSFPESSSTGPGGTMVFLPSTENFEIRLKFKPTGELIAYYPQIKVSMMQKEETVLKSNVNKFLLDKGKTKFNIIFDSDITVYSVIKTEELIYEINEKIEI